MLTWLLVGCAKDQENKQIELSDNEEGKEWKLPFYWSQAGNWVMVVKNTTVVTDSASKTEVTLQEGSFLFLPNAYEPVAEANGKQLRIPSVSLAHVLPIDTVAGLYLTKQPFASYIGDGDDPKVHKLTLWKKGTLLKQVNAVMTYQYLIGHHVWAQRGSHFLVMLLDMPEACGETGRPYALNVSSAGDLDTLGSSVVMNEAGVLGQYLDTSSRGTGADKVWLFEEVWSQTLDAEKDITKGVFAREQVFKYDASRGFYRAGVRVKQPFKGWEDIPE